MKKKILLKTGLGAIIFCLIASLPVDAVEKSEKFDLPSILSHELMDSVLFELNLFGKKKYLQSKDLLAIKSNTFVRKYTFTDSLGSYTYEGGLDLHVTRRVAQMTVISIVLIFLGILGKRKIAGNVTKINGRFANMLEVFFIWSRKEIAEGSMPGHARTYHPYLLTLFLFILFLNLAGLMPQMGQALVLLSGFQGDIEESPLLALWPGITVTGDISVTFTLAVATVFMIWFAGFRYQGFSFIWNVVPKGVPLPLYVIMWPLEFIVGPLAKGFALMIRLLANMTAGHVVILVLLSFIFNTAPLWNSTILAKFGAGGITLVAMVGILGIFLLEILVSFLQAFIFTLLSALFISASMHRH